MMDENTPSEAAEGSVTLENHKVVAAVVYAVGTLSVMALGAVGAAILDRSVRLTVDNLGHVIATKGKIWLPSQFRDLTNI